MLVLDTIVLNSPLTSMGEVLTRAFYRCPYPTLMNCYTTMWVENTKFLTLIQMV